MKNIMMLVKGKKSARSGGTCLESQLLGRAEVGGSPANASLGKNMRSYPKKHKKQKDWGYGSTDSMP
jgi:hypothetical protein